MGKKAPTVKERLHLSYYNILLQGKNDHFFELINFLKVKSRKFAMYSNMMKLCGLYIFLEIIFLFSVEFENCLTSLYPGAPPGFYGLTSDTFCDSPGKTTSLYTIIS